MKRAKRTPRRLLVLAIALAIVCGMKTADALGSLPLSSASEPPAALNPSRLTADATSGDLIAEIAAIRAATAADAVVATGQAAPDAAAPQARPASAVLPAAAAPPAFSCGAAAFCYPRLALAGPIVPYSDCGGTTDVGTQIRSLTCVSDHYLAAHAYTSFGGIAGWRAGDVVLAYGQRFVVYGAFTQDGCRQPARALAPLSLQTSLTPRTCGPILVVQARPG